MVEDVKHVEQAGRDAGWRRGVHFDFEVINERFEGEDCEWACEKKGKIDCRPSLGLNRPPFGPRKSRTDRRAGDDDVGRIQLQERRDINEARRKRRIKHRA